MTVCRRCLLTSDIPGIMFDADGICNYCKMHDGFEREYPVGSPKLAELIEQIKKKGKRHRYDCIVGISGGTDSSYLLHKAINWDLRPLAFHFDNGWNTDIAEINMRRMVEGLGIDFLRVGVDREEFDDICRSFLLASVPDADIANDIGITTMRHFIADKMGVGYALAGHSFRTEGSAPLGWTYMDGQYVADVHSKFGRMPMRDFPNLWLRKWLYWAVVRQIRRPRPLWYIDYNKEEAKRLLAKRYGWKDYGGHHAENKYTAFCTNYYQPEKFGIDLRYVEFSALVRSGQMTRGEGLRRLKQPPVLDEGIIREVKKRLDLTDDEFRTIMRDVPRTHRDYKTYRPIFKRLRWLFYVLSRLEIVPKTFYVKYTR